MVPCFRARKWSSAPAPHLFAIGLISAMAASAAGCAREPARPRSDAPLPAYPTTRVDDVVERVFGVEVRDPYRWLEAGNAPEVKAWMHAEDDLTRTRIASLPERAGLAERMRDLAGRERFGVPVFRDRRVLYMHAAANEERMGLYVRDAEGGPERAVLSPARWLEAPHAALGYWSVSPDGARVAYEVKSHNADDASLRVVEVATGRVSEIDTIAGVQQAKPQWTPRGDAFYYVHYPKTPEGRIDHAHGDLRLHVVGGDPRADVVVRGPTPAQSWLDVELEPHGRWLVATVWFGFSECDVYTRDLRAAVPAWAPIAVGRRAHFVAHASGDTLVLLSKDGAPNGEVFVVDLASEDRAWHRVVPERRDAPLLDVTVVGGHIVLSYLENVSSNLELRSLDGALVRRLPAPRLATIHAPVGSPDRDEMAFEVESFTTPSEIYRSSVRTGETSLWHASRVNADLSRYETEQRFYRSKDGTSIPIFLVHEKGLRRDGSARALLYGYGGYNSPQRPSFDPFLVPWLERGGVYAVANLRGGSEYGEAWHRAGRRRSKQNVFDDFAAAAEFLTREKYTHPSRLAVEGMSNGGLTVAALLTQRPELFAAGLCQVPMADMVRVRIESADELGTPSDPDDFRTLYAYSPYHHIARGRVYPSVLITTGEFDDRGDPMHARKLAAALQAASGGGEALLRVEWGSGHHGSDASSLDAERMADAYAFLLAHTGGTL